MENKHILIEKLRNWEYYRTKLPLYLQNSYGIEDHFYMLYEILSQLDVASANLLKGFDIFSSDYLDYVKSITNNQNNYDLLDKLGYIYGVNRNFDVTFTNSQGQNETHSLSLNDYELLTLILSEVILSSFDGTYESIRSLYDRIKLPIYVFTDNDNIQVNMYLDEGRIENISDNIKYMFLAGLFNLPSLGIKYSNVIVSIANIAMWDSIDEKKYWDKGLWS